MAKAGDAKLKEITVQLKATDVSDISDGTTYVDLDDLVNNVYLYYGGNVIASAAVPLVDDETATTVDLVLTPSSYVTLPADQRATFELKIDMPAIAPTSDSYGDSVALTVNKVYAENSATYQAIEKLANFTGKKMYAYINYPTLALVGSNPVPTLDPNTSTLAGATIQMAVTANGSDIYISATSGAGVVVASTASSSTSTLSGPGVEFVGNNFIVRNGETKTFSVAITMDNSKTNSTAGQKQAWIEKFIWDTDATAGGAITWSNMLGLGSATIPGSIFYTLPVNMAGTI